MTTAIVRRKNKTLTTIRRVRMKSHLWHVFRAGAVDCWQVMPEFEFDIFGVVVKEYSEVFWLGRKLFDGVESVETLNVVARAEEEPEEVERRKTNKHKKTSKETLRRETVVQKRIFVCIAASFVCRTPFLNTSFLLFTFLIRHSRSTWLSLVPTHWVFLCVLLPEKNEEYFDRKKPLLSGPAAIKGILG